MKEGIASWEQEEKVIQEEGDVIKNPLEMKNVVFEMKKLGNRIKTRLISRTCLRMTRVISVSDVCILSIK